MFNTTIIPHIHSVKESIVLLSSYSAIIVKLHSFKGGFYRSPLHCCLHNSTTRGDLAIIHLKNKCPDAIDITDDNTYMPHSVLKIAALDHVASDITTFCM